MKRDRDRSSSLNINSSHLPLTSSQTSPSDRSSMSKRSRVGGSRYPPGGGGGGDEDPDSPIMDNRSSSHGRHGGHGSEGGRSPSNNNGRRHGGGGDEYRSYGSSYKEHRSVPRAQGPPPPSSSSSSSSGYPYKVLCMSKLCPKASDDFIRDSLYREFKRYGDISIKVVNEPDERVAYVYFRSAEDAREVKHSKNKIYIYDRPVKVEAAYESAPQQQGGGGGGGYKQQTGGPVGDYGDKYSSNNRSSASYSSSSYAYRSPPSSYDRRDDRGGGGGYDRYPPPSGGPPPHHHAPHHHHHPPQPPMYNNSRDSYGGGGGGGGRDYNRDSYQQQPYARYPPGPPPQSHHYNSSHMAPPPHHSMGAPSLGPPRHHPPPGPPMGGGHPGADPGMGGGGPRARSFENKKDKFPNYLQHITPEEDPLATRTLFAGNLEVNITDEELRRIFGRYGILEDIDIKRPPPGTGNAYAFVRFVNLDMAARAKSEVSGQYIGKFQCKIGYGKRNPTTKVWVGGLGGWTTLQMLEREFDRFGSIKTIDWEKGAEFAYITYETIDAAQAAVKDMRGYPLGGSDKRLRTDFADAGAPLVLPGGGSGEWGGGGGGGGRGDNNQSDHPPVDWGTNGNGPKRRETSIKTSSPHSSNDLGSPGRPETWGDDDAPPRGSGSSALSSARSIADISAKAPVAWTGGLILKLSSFPTRFYLTDGELEGVDALLKDEEGRNLLKIMQRLKLEQGKLEDVQKRISVSSSHGIFLALPTTTSNLSSPTPPQGDNVQSRPLRNLVSYLKTKDAAGVISSKGGSGVIYVFPPCPFSWSLLKRGAPGLVAGGGGGDADSKEQQDHLVVVVIN